MKTHLLKIANKGVKICTKVTMPILEELRNEVAAFEAATTLGTPRSVPLPMELSFSPTSTGLPPSGAKTSKKKKSGIVESFHLELRQLADAYIAIMFSHLMSLNLRC